MLAIQILFYKIKKNFHNKQKNLNKTTVKFTLNVVKLKKLTFLKKFKETQINLNLLQITDGARCASIKQKIK